MIKNIILISLMLSTVARAGDLVGNVFFGDNLAKTVSEHTDRLYLKINDSEKLYFNRPHRGPILENLDLDENHIVKVYFDDKLVQSWVLNYSKLKTRSVVIWRASGSWRMTPAERPMSE